MLQLILLIIIGFFIGLSYPTGLEPLFFNPLISLGATLISSALYICLGFILVGYFLKKLRTHSGNNSRLGRHCEERSDEAISIPEDGDAPDYDQLSRMKMPTGGTHRDPEAPLLEWHHSGKSTKRYHRWLARYRILILPVYAIQVFLLHWPLVITHWLGLSNIIFITNLLILLPFLGTYILSWIPFYRMDRHFRGSTWNLREYLLFQIRGYFLLVIGPLLVFILYLDIIYHVPALLEMLYTYPFSGWLMALSIILLMYLIAPYCLMILWGTQPFPSGELRDRLANMAQQAGVKIKNILVWSLGKGRMANAMIIGFIPWARYIVFTDTLLNNLTTDEIATVFGHEIGHSKHHHLRLYFLFALGYLFLALTIEEFSRSISGMMTLNLFALVIIYWGVIFGAMSREFEKQSDLFGATITHNFAGFISALQKIAWLNGQSPSARSLQHPSIETRVNFLRTVQLLPERTVKFQNALNTRIRLFMVLLILSLISAGWSIWQQTQRTPALKIEFAIQTRADQLAQQGYELIVNQEYDEATQTLYQAIALVPNYPLAYIWLGDAYAERDGQNSPEAYRAYEQARRLKPVDPLKRMYLYEKLSAHHSGLNPITED